MLARQAGTLALAIALRHGGAHRRVVVTALGQDGTGADGLRVRVGGVAATPCGHGCYAASPAPAPQGRRLVVAVTGPGTTPSTTTYVLPRRWPVPAASLVRRMAATLRQLHAVTYEDRLASRPGFALHTRFRVEAPDRLAYTILHGGAAIVIGSTRWDRAAGSARWQRSTQDPPLDLPAVPWTSRAYDASLLGRRRVEGRRAVVVSLYDPWTPAWYEVAADARTLQPLVVDMVGGAHFMHDVYVGFDRPQHIVPPPAASVDGS